MKASLIVAALVLVSGGATRAQTPAASCYTTGSQAWGYTTTCRPQQTDYSWLTQPSRQAATAAGQQAGALINHALEKPRVVAISTVIECGKYTLVTITYSNGSQTQDRVEDATIEYQSKLAGMLAGIKAQGSIAVAEQSIACSTG